MRLRRLAGGLGLAATAGAWSLVEAESTVASACLALYVVAPWAALSLGTKSLTDKARAVALALVTALTVGLYGAFAYDDASTGALVFVFLAIYQWAVIGTAVIAVRTLTVQRREREAGE